MCFEMLICHHLPANQLQSVSIPTSCLLHDPPFKSFYKVHIITLVARFLIKEEGLHVEILFHIICHLSIWPHVA